MYSYFIGEIVEIEDDQVVLEVNKIGYNIKISLRVAEQLQQMSGDIKIYTFTHVKEDTLQLYGFLDREELRLFRMMLGVSGIGPKGGLAILSLLDADALKVAILTSDSKAISKASGIGAKTAERLIIDLKDKVTMEDITYINRSSENAISSISDGAKEAMEALTALGYPSSEAMKAVKSVSADNSMDAEQILKLALRHL